MIDILNFDCESLKILNDFKNTDFSEICFQSSFMPIQQIIIICVIETDEPNIPPLVLAFINLN